MDFIKNNWIILLILAIVIYFVYKYYKKTKEVAIVSNNSANNNIVSSFKNVISSNTGYIEPAKTVTVPIKNLDYNSWKIGDKMYAGEIGSNLYNTSSPTADSLIRHYNKDIYIGDYLGNVNGYAKLAVSQKSNALLDTFGYDENITAYSPVKTIYKK